jgi:DNA-binding transcriptional LysR family regulator
VARSGSILKAASEVGLTQPALSKCVADLEETLAVRLFDRTNRGVIATPHGEILLRRAMTIFEELRGAVNELDALDDSTRGEVRVGATPTVCAGVLPRAINSYLEERPNFKFEVSELPLEKLASDVLMRGLDFGIGRVPEEHDDLAFEKLFDDRLFIVAGAFHPLVKRRAITLADSVEYPWVLPRADGAMASQIRDVFQEQGLRPPHSSVTVMSVVARYELIATNRSLSLMYGSVLRLGTAPSHVCVLPINLPVSVPIGVIRHKSRTLGASALAFIDATRKITEVMHSVDARRLKRSAGAQDSSRNSPTMSRSGRSARA